MGVVVRRYIDILTIIINFPYSTYISSFFGSTMLWSAVCVKTQNDAGIYNSCWYLRFMLVFTIHAGIYTSCWYRKYQHEV